jgi:hypothetical protein
LISPLDGALDIENNNADLISWNIVNWMDESNSELITYDFYFGTNPSPPKLKFIPAGQTSPNSIQTEPKTTYYWQSKARDGQANVLSESKIWSFTTSE